MRIPMRAAFRLALTGWLGLAAFAIAASTGVAAEPPEKTHPGSTLLFVKVTNAAAFRESLRESQFGQLWSDPALKPFKEDLANRLDDSTKEMKSKVGVSLRELLELPEGAATLAVVPAGGDDDAKPALLLTADAGKNASKMNDVLTKATQQGEESGAKVSKQEFKGLTLHTIQPPKPKTAKDDDATPPPIVWTHDKGLFYIGTDADAVKDLIAHASGRDDSLAASENYAKAVKKLGADPHVIWFVDAGKALQLVYKAGAKGKNAANLEQFKTMSQVLGVNGLKAAAGSYTLNSGNYDSVSRTIVLAPAPVQGILKLFVMPKAALKPEAWVPLTVASYQSWSFNFDDAYKNLNDLANMFQPGVLNVLEQQLVGPNGGEPLNLKKDLFDPLGNRVTLISDYKKPVTEDSQRMLLAVSVDKEKELQDTLAKLIDMTGAAPKKREFQGTTIYDFDIPAIPNPNGNQVQFKGPVSLTVAKHSLFVSTAPEMLEQALRGGGPSLADSPAYHTVAKELPTQVSSLTYVRPDEQARVSYEMIKSGQFEKALQGAGVGGGPNVAKIGKMFDKDKLPDFSVFARYLSQGGGYSVMDDDGISFTSFTMRKSNP